MASDGKQPAAGSYVHSADQGAYWNEIWDKKATGWKAFETDAHHRAVFQNRLQSGSTQMWLLKDQGKGSQVPAVGKKYTDANPLRILVPLCGDSPIMTYLISEALLEDFPKELDGVPIEVVGIDLAAKAFDSLLGNASLGEFVKGSLTSKIKGDDVEVAKTFTLTRRVGGGDDGAKRKLTLVAGDFFAVMSDTALADAGFDAVWDRASVVALPPNLRVQYTKALETSLVNRHKESGAEEARGPMPFPYRGIFLETVRRPEGKRVDGPPFHVNEVVATNLDAWPEDQGASLSHEELLTLRYCKVHFSQEYDADLVQQQQLEMAGGDAKKLPPFDFHAYVGVLQ